MRRQILNPNKIYHNGKVITVDRNQSIQEAFSVADGKFLSVGSTRDILATAGPDTELIDLQQKSVVPGLIDGHCHLLSASTSEFNGEIPTPRDLAELTDWISVQISQKQPGEWIVIDRIFPTRIKELRLLTLSELDAIAPDNPVFLNASFSGVVNSEALRISNLYRNTSHPGVMTDKSSDRPTGVLHRSAFNLLVGLPQHTATEDELYQAAREMFHRYNSVGITSATDVVPDQQTIDFYRKLLKAGDLSLRMCLDYRPKQPMNKTDTTRLAGLVDLKTGDGNEWLRMGPFKVMLDGGMLSGTACMRKPWGARAAEIFGTDNPDDCGIINYTQDQLTEVVHTAHDLGWSFTAHTTGDGAVELLLNAYAELHRESPITEMRFSLLHANFLPPDQIRRCRKMGILIDIQPIWFYKDADAMLDILGSDRMRAFHTYNSILQSGLLMCAGSDHMVKLDPKDSINPFDPFFGMYAMITHKTEQETSIMPEEAISRIDALRAYTINNAFKSEEETIKGSIEKGKLADFAILDADFLQCPPEQFLDMPVAETVSGGNTVYVS